MEEPVADSSNLALRKMAALFNLRQYLDDWFDGKKAETAPSTMTFYRTSLTKFLQFLGKRSDDPMTEVTKQDVVAFRNSLIPQDGKGDDPAISAAATKTAGA